MTNDDTTRRNYRRLAERMAADAADILDGRTPQSGTHPMDAGVRLSCAFSIHARINGARVQWQTPLSQLITLYVPDPIADALDHIPVPADRVPSHGGAAYLLTEDQALALADHIEHHGLDVNAH